MLVIGRTRSLSGLDLLPQRGIMRVVNRRVEQRPGLRLVDDDGDGRNHQTIVGFIACGRLVVLSSGRIAADAIQYQNDFLQRPSGKFAFRFPARNNGIGRIENALRQVLQPTADSFDSESDDFVVVHGNCCRQNTCEICGIAKPHRGSVPFIGANAVTNRGQIGDEIRLLLRQKPKIELTVKIIDDLVEGIEASVMKIRRVEIRVDQGWGSKKPSTPRHAACDR